jgi:hypothetical protein
VITATAYEQGALPRPPPPAGMLLSLGTIVKPEMHAERRTSLFDRVLDARADVQQSR